jgi:ketosteroid isomerase-like protein
MKIFSLETAVGLVVGVAAAVGFYQYSTSREPDTTADAEAIRQAVRDFEAGWNAEDIGIIHNIYADPHEDINKHVPLESVAATEETIRAFFNDTQSHIEITSDKVEVLPHGWALQQGSFRLTYAPEGGGETEEMFRKYIEVFHKQPDGRWKVVWSMDGPLSD